MLNTTDHNLNNEKSLLNKLCTTSKCIKPSKTNATSLQRSRRFNQLNSCKAIQKRIKPSIIKSLPKTAVIPNQYQRNRPNSLQKVLRQRRLTIISKLLRSEQKTKLESRHRTSRPSPLFTNAIRRSERNQRSLQVLSRQSN